MDRRTSMYLLTIVFREYGEMAVEDVSRIMVVFFWIIVKFRLEINMLLLSCLSKKTYFVPKKRLCSHVNKTTKITEHMGIIQSFEITL